MTALTLPPGLPGPVQQALSLLRANPRESAGAGLLLLAGCLSVAAIANGGAATQAKTQEAAAAAPSVQEMTPFAVRQVAPDEAQKLNAAVPLAGGPTPAAAPFVLKTDAKTHGRPLGCLRLACN